MWTTPLADSLQSRESKIELMSSNPQPAPRTFTNSSSLSTLVSSPSPTDVSPSDNPKGIPPSNNPRTLNRRSAMKIVWLIWDILLCCVPLSFLVLAGMTSALSGSKVSEYGQRVIDWSLLGPTIFLIFFAAIVGRTMKFVAQYKLERGASIDVSTLSRRCIPDRILTWKDSRKTRWKPKRVCCFHDSDSNGKIWSFEYRYPPSLGIFSAWWQSLPSNPPYQIQQYYRLNRLCVSQYDKTDY